MRFDASAHFHQRGDTRPASRSLAADLRSEPAAATESLDSAFIRGDLGLAKVLFEMKEK